MKRRGRRPSKYNLIFWEALPNSTQRPIGEILSSIDQMTKEAFMAVGTPRELEQLSTAAAKLPAYLTGLGYWLADAEQALELAKDDYEYMRLKKEKAVIDSPEKISVAEAERIVGVDDELVLERDKLRKSKHNYRILKLKYESAARVFEGWRSRLAVIRNDVRNPE